MSIPKRKGIPKTTQSKILSNNLGVCCVCKERGVGINLHHIDGDPSNNGDDNIAILCVKEHDQHHRPKVYEQSKHLELTANKIKEFKIEWEQTVRECSADNPKIIAVLNVYGDYNHIHSVRLIIQNLNSDVIYERVYHLLLGTYDQWIDSILDEVDWLGKKVKLAIVNEPQKVEYCPCCSKSLLSTLDRNVTIYITALDWQEKSLAIIYINPNRSSLAFTLFYGEELLYTALLHKCNGKHLHFQNEKYEERTPIKKTPSIRTQATEIIQKVIDTWKPGQILIGTGDPDKPTLINDVKLPNIWEK